jgi:hypothetical protein
MNMSKVVSQVMVLLGMVWAVSSCSDAKTKPTSKAESKHHLNIPAKGIESLMEANSQKVIEGTDGSVIVAIGEVTRKQADISIKRNDKIVDERLVTEKESIQFDYEGQSYTVLVKNIKKPLIGEGKVELSIQ